MENIFSKIIVVSICVFIASCHFDGESIEVLDKMNEHYYVLKDASADYGLQIGYSSDDINYQILSSYSDNIYYNSDTIMYSEVAFKGDSTSSYFIIPVNPKRKDGLANDPIQVKESVFKSSNIARLKKVNLSR